jgi:hypothetical protein
MFPKSGLVVSVISTSSGASTGLVASKSVMDSSTGGGDGNSSDKAFMARAAEYLSSNKILQDNSPSHSTYDGPYAEKYAYIPKNIRIQKHRMIHEKG